MKKNKTIFMVAGCRGLLSFNLDRGNEGFLRLDVLRFGICPVPLLDTFMKSTTFGKRLIEVKKDKKISQNEVGKLVGVHGAVIGRYEREKVEPSIEVATQLAEVLEILWIIS